MAKITVADLIRIGACDYAIFEFRRCFGGDEVEATAENAEKFQRVYSGWLSYGVDLLSEDSRVQFKRFFNAVQNNGQHEGVSETDCPACATIRAKFVELYNKDHAADVEAASVSEQA